MDEINRIRKRNQALQAWGEMVDNQTCEYLFKLFMGTPFEPIPPEVIEYESRLERYVGEY